MGKSGIAIIVLLVILLLVALTFLQSAEPAAVLGAAESAAEPAASTAKPTANSPSLATAFELAQAAVRVREGGSKQRSKAEPTKWGKQKTWKGIEGNPGAAAAFRADAKKIRRAAKSGRLDWATVIGDMNDKLWRPAETWAARVGIGREVAGVLKLEIVSGGLTRIGPPGPGDGGGLARDKLEPELAAECAASYGDPECEETPDEFYSRPALIYLVTGEGGPDTNSSLNAARATAARALSRGRGAADAYLSPAGRIDLRLS